MFFFFGALPNDKLKIKHTKKWKEIPSRYVLKNLLEKSKHSYMYCEAGLFPGFVTFQLKEHFGNHTFSVLESLTTFIIAVSH